MKKTINLGAYGWRHEYWLDSFYPEDLPADWQLGYYSNEFNTVLVPADYWLHAEMGECEDWLDEVHAGFHFFVECHARMFDKIAPADLIEALTGLKPQLSGLVFLGDRQMPGPIKDQFDGLIDTLSVQVFGIEHGGGIQQVWRPGRLQDDDSGMAPPPRLALIEDVLTDLRSTRALIEPFTGQLSDAGADTDEAALIVNHPQLKAADLAKLRSVLEIMGH